MEVTHQIRDKAGLAVGLLNLTVVVCQKLTDTCFEEGVEFVNRRDGESWSKKLLQVLVRFRTATDFVSRVHERNLRGLFYISPNNPGLFRSLEISAYIVTLGKSVFRRMSFIAVLSATQICLGPSRITSPYFL